MSWSCYLATPIDQTMGDGWDSVYELKSALETAGAVVYAPILSLRQPDPDGNPFAQRVHDAALMEADAVLAVLPDGVPSIGVPMEIQQAVTDHKPVAVLCGEAAYNSTVLAARPGVSLFQLGDGVEVNMAIGWLAATQMKSSSAPAGADPPTGNLSDAIDTFLSDVRVEIARAMKKHPHSNDPTWTTTERWFAIAIEELAEALTSVIQRWNDAQLHEPVATWEDVLTELVQTGAMSARLYASILQTKLGAFVDDTGDDTVVVDMGPGYDGSPVLAPRPPLDEL